MHSVHAAILSEFKRNPAKVYSTTDIVRVIFREEYRPLDQLLNSSDRKIVRQGLQQKARLQRRALYHVGRLEKERILTLVDVQRKGEKLFKLATEAAHQTGRAGFRPLLSKSVNFSTALSSYEQSGVVRKLGPDDWLMKEDAVLLEGNSFKSIDQLRDRLNDLLPAIRDVVALDRFEKFMMVEDAEHLASFLRELGLDAHDHGTRVNVLLNLQHVENPDPFLSAAQTILNDLPSNVDFFLAAHPRMLSTQEQVVSKLLSLFRERMRKLVFRNSLIHGAPILMGNAGPYTFSLEEYNHYITHTTGDADGCILGGMSLEVDTSLHFRNGNGIRDFRDMLAKIASSLFEAEQWKRQHLYGTCLELPKNPEHAKAFISPRRNYIRFLSRQLAEGRNRTLIDLLESAKAEMSEFCAVQEMIFKSCGLPIKFRIGFADLLQDSLQRKRLAATNLRDLQSRKAREHIYLHERLFRLFGGANSFSLQVNADAKMNDLLSMCRYLFNGHHLPSILFDFSRRNGDLKLTSWVENG